MRYFLIDLANKLGFTHCDGCGKRMKGWKANLWYEVPVCPACSKRVVANLQADYIIFQNAVLHLDRIEDR